MTVLVGLLPVDAGAFTEVWLSSVGVPDGTVTVGDYVEAFDSPRGSGELNIWIRPEQGQVFDYGVALQLISETPGVIDLTDVTVHNPATTLVEPPLDGWTTLRWEFISDSTTIIEHRYGPPRPTMDLSGPNDNTTEQLTGVKAFGTFVDADIVTGLGGELGESIDPLYDPTADAWLFATARYDVVGTGTTDLFLQIGSAGIAGRGLETAAVNVVFGAGDDPPLNAGDDGHRETNSATPDGSITVGFQELVAQMVTASPVGLSQIVETPAAGFEFVFDYQFLTTTGVLDVLLDGVSLGTIGAPATLASGFATASLAVDNALLNQTDVVLEFVLDGPSGSTLLLNDIEFPELQNGDFQRGGILGWTTTANGSVESVAVAAVPEPSGLVLAFVALAGLAWCRQTAVEPARALFLGLQT